MGDHIQLQDAAALYFRTVHTWFPIVSEAAYRTRLSSLRVKIATAPSEFSLLVLCVALSCKGPINGELPPSSLSLYTSLKSIVALLEAMGVNTLETVQSRALLTIFEIGHAIHPAACISAAANACAAAALGIDTTNEKLHELLQDPQRAEEARQTWRGVMIIKRLEVTSTNIHRIPYTDSYGDRYSLLESNQAPSIPRGQCIDMAGFKEVSNYPATLVDFQYRKLRLEYRRRRIHSLNWPMPHYFWSRL